MKKEDTSEEKNREEILTFILENLKNIEEYSQNQQCFEIETTKQLLNTKEELEQRIKIDANVKIIFEFDIKFFKLLNNIIFKTKEDGYIYIISKDNTLYFMDEILDVNFECQSVSINITENNVVLQKVSSLNFVCCCKRDTLGKFLKTLVSESCDIFMSVSFEEEYLSEIEFYNYNCNTEEEENIITEVESKADVIKNFMETIKKTQTPKEFLEFKDEYIEQIFKIERNSYAYLEYIREGTEITLAMDSHDYNIKNVVKETQFTDSHNFKEKLQLNNNFEIINGMRKLIYFMFENQSVFRSEYFEIPSNQVNVYYIFNL